MRCPRRSVRRVRDKICISWSIFNQAPDSNTGYFRVVFALGLKTELSFPFRRRPRRYVRYLLLRDEANALHVADVVRNTNNLRVLVISRPFLPSLFSPQFTLRQCSDRLLVIACDYSDAATAGFEVYYY